MPRVSVSKATTAIVSLLVVASLFVFSQWISARLAANGIVSAVFLVLVLVVTIAGMGSRQVRRLTPGKRRKLRYAAPALLVLLAPALVWALFGTSFQGLVTVLPTGSITLNSPNDVIVDSQGNVYIADTHNNQIVEVTAFGVASIVTFPGLSPALHNPNGVAIDGLGNLYVADSSNSRIVELSRGVASVIATGGLLSYPDGLVVDTAGDLFIADGANNDIVEVPAGGAAAVLTVTGVGALAGPQGLAFDVSGNLYIADGGNNRIVKVAPGGAGTVLSITGGVTLNTPLGVAVDGPGNVYIADRQNNRIVTVTPGGAGNVLYTAGMTLLSPEGVAVGVSGAVYVADYSGIAEVQDSAVGFGHLPTGAVSGTTLTLPITIAYNATFGSVQAFTQGTAGLDFTVASTTCVAGVTNDGPCTVNVTFLPTAAGLRRGAMVVYNNATPNVPILTVPLYAFADATLSSLAPNAGSVINTGGVTLSSPFQVALDGAGNMYVADDGEEDSGNVVRIPTGGGAATVVALGTPGGDPIQEIVGVAVDGAGNLFISDHENERILVVTPAGVLSILSITGLSPVLGEPVALTFDGAGNLYISDYSNGRIVRVSTLVVAGSTSSGLGTVIGTGAFTFTEDTLTGLAVDAQGNIYADAQNSGSVVKVTAAGVASELSFPGIAPAINDAQGVAVDAMGNVYVVDSANQRIVRLTTAGVASALGISGLPAPSGLGSTLFGVTLDPSGNLYISDFVNNRIVFVNVSASALAFPSTDVGSTSSPQTATVANLGDLPLIFATAPTYTVNFSEDTGDENLCILGTSLASGTACDVSVEFTPQSAGSLSAGIVVTNNSLNLTATPQTLAVSGTGIVVADTTAVVVSTNPTSVVLGQSITLTAIVTDTTTGHAATVPTGGVTFMDTVGSTTVSLIGGAAVTLNGSGAAILNGVTLAGAGTHTIAAHYAGVSGSFLASSNTTTVQVSAGPIPPTINWTAPEGGITYGVTLSAILNATATSGSTTVAGTFTYTATLAGGSPIAVASATVLAAGSYTLTATFTPTDTTTYASTSASAALTVGKATPELALASSAAAVGAGAAVTFTATVSSSAGTPGGSVGFYAGTTLLGSGTLDSGVATYTTTNLPVGALSITAMYSGDANFLTLTSAAFTETVMTAFTVTAPVTPVPVAPGGAVAIDLNVPPLGGAFSGVVTLSATGLPPGATATFNPPTVTPGSAGAPTVMTIQLAALTAGIPARNLPARDLPAKHRGLPLAPFSLGFVLFGAVLGRKRIPRTLLLVAVFASLGLATSLLTGCGGGFANNPTQAGSYIITVTGTSGPFQASTTMTLVVE
jgi:sugar lactone lactonase YvrE